MGLYSARPKGPLRRIQHVGRLPPLGIGPCPAPAGPQRTVLRLLRLNMETKTIGVILSGVTGRMGTNQHLVRSILAIIKQGGIKVSDTLRLMPDPILVGRSVSKL